MTASMPHSATTDNPRRQPSGFLAAFSLTATIAVLLAVFLNYLVDPLQYYRRYTLGPAVFDRNQRYQNPGLARNYDYDTIILGTSITDNFRPSEIDRATGWKTLKLSMDGSTGFEQRMTAEVALRSGRVSRVLWVLQWESFASDLTAMNESLGGIPLEMYTDGTLAVIRTYLLSVTTLHKTARMLLGLGKKDLDTLNHWSEHTSYGCRAIAEKMSRTREHIESGWRSGTLRTANTDLAQNLANNLFATIHANPQVEFFIVLPPMSVWYLALLPDIDPALAESFYTFRSLVAARLLGRTNAHLLDFQGVSAIVAEPNNYRDPRHFVPAVNDAMIAAIEHHTMIPLASRRAIETIVERTHSKCAIPHQVRRPAGMRDRPGTGTRRGWTLRPAVH